MELCAEAAPDRPNTWINSPILNLYSALHRDGPRAQRRGVARWRAGRRALWRQPERRVLRREHVLARDRRVKGRAGASRRAAARGRLSAARYAVRHRATSRPSASRKSRARISTSACTDALQVDARFRNADLLRVGSAAADHPDVVGRVFEGAEARRGRIHPAREQQAIRPDRLRAAIHLRRCCSGLGFRRAPLSPAR